MRHARNLIATLKGGGAGGPGPAPLSFTVDNHNFRADFDLEPGWPLLDPVTSDPNYRLSTDSGANWHTIKERPAEILLWNDYAANTVWLNRIGLPDIYKNLNPYSLNSAAHTGKIRLLIWGDSNTAATAAAIAAIADPNKYDILVVSLAGYTLGMLEASADTFLAGLFNPAYDTHMCIILGGTNDNNNSNGPASIIFQAYQGCVNKAKKWGFGNVFAFVCEYGQNPFIGSWGAFYSWKALMMADYRDVLGCLDIVDSNSLDSPIRVNAYSGGNPAYWASGGNDPLHGTALFYAYRAQEIMAKITLYENIVHYIPTDPTVVLNLAGDELTVTGLATQTKITDLLLTQDGGATYTTVTTHPIPVNPAVAANQKGVKIRGINGNNPGNWVFA